MVKLCEEKREMGGNFSLVVVALFVENRGWIRSVYLFATTLNKENE